jgi:hypothetical protein
MNTLRKLDLFLTAGEGLQTLHWVRQKEPTSVKGPALEQGSPMLSPEFSKTLYSSMFLSEYRKIHKSKITVIQSPLGICE